jgi:hypothetical protein
VTPDFLCLSKGLTGGFLPMSAVLTTSDVYDAFPDRDSRERAFLHSHSYTGNPLGCAAALARCRSSRTSLVLEREQADRKADERTVRRRSPRTERGRGAADGMILAIELVADKATRTPFAAAASAACAPTGARWRKAWCCARSARCCTGCRPTASTRRRCSSCARHRRRDRGGLRLMRSDPPLRRPAAGEGASSPAGVALAHLVRVLRLGRGDRVRLFNGDGHDYDAELRSTASASARARARAHRGRAANRRWRSRSRRASRAARRWT